ncbi:MAG: DUF3417 domain-containing protein, partial [Thermodesulfobacteriota bacterium]
MSHIKIFNVFPKVPEPLEFLTTLARNLWWSWQRDAVELFRRIDPRRWDDTRGNPLVFSTKVTQKRLEELAEDESFLAHLHKVEEDFNKQVKNPIDYAQSPYGKDKS